MSISSAGCDPQSPPNTAASSTNTAFSQITASRTSSTLSSSTTLLQRGPRQAPHHTRRHPHLSVRSTAPKPPLMHLSKPQNMQLTRLMPSVNDTRGAGRTSSAEDMALLRLEPRRRHRSLRVSADRVSTGIMCPDLPAGICSGTSVLIHNHCLTYFLHCS